MKKKKLFKKSFTLIEKCPIERRRTYNEGRWRTMKGDVALNIIDWLNVYLTFHTKWYLNNIMFNRNKIKKCWQNF